MKGKEMNTGKKQDAEIKSLRDGHCLGILHYIANAEGTITAIDEREGRMVFTVIGEASRLAKECSGDNRIDVVELDGIGPFYASDDTLVADTHAPCRTWYTHEQLLAMRSNN
jgi:hypothetical protein